MKRNIGKFDMMIRFGIGFTLFYLGFYDNPVFTAPVAKNIVGFVGFVPIVTGMVRFCPLYTLAGINTRYNQPPAPRK